MEYKWSGYSTRGQIYSKWRRWEVTDCKSNNDEGNERGIGKILIGGYMNR